MKRLIIFIFVIFSFFDCLSNQIDSSDNKIKNNNTGAFAYYTQIIKSQKNIATGSDFICIFDSLYYSQLPLDAYPNGKLISHSEYLVHIKQLKEINQIKIGNEDTISYYIEIYENWKLINRYDLKFNNQIPLYRDLLFDILRGKYKYK
jgi:hypothetical protein